MAIVLELLSRNNKTIKTYRFNTPQVTIGRDYQNDLQLDDPYVCPQHLQISQLREPWSLQLADCQSVNGVSINRKKRLSSEKTQLQANDVIELGRTRLRVVDISKGIPPTLPLGKLEHNMAWLTSTGLALSLTIAYFLYALVTNFFASVDEFKLASAIPKELAQMAVFCAWPLAFALLSKVFNTESHLMSQFNLMWLVIFLLNILHLLDTVILFNSNGSPSLLWLTFLVFSIVVWGFVWLSLFIGFHQSPLRRNLTTGLLSVMILLPIFSLGLFDDGEFSPRANYEATLLPPIYDFSARKDSEDFVRQSKGLFTKLAQEIQDEKP